jgi:hypothetical protein
LAHSVVQNVCEFKIRESQSELKVNSKGDEIPMAVSSDIDEIENTAYYTDLHVLKHIFCSSSISTQGKA